MNNIEELEEFITLNLNRANNNLIYALAEEPDPTDTPMNRADWYMDQAKKITRYHTQVTDWTNALTASKNIAIK